MTRFAIIRLSALGDLIHTLPALQRLRLAFPGAQIDWLVQPPGDKLLECFSGIDRVLPLDLRQRRFAEVWGELRGLRRLPEYEAVLDFQGLLKSALVSRWLRGKRYGFHPANLREKAARFAYHRCAAPFPEERHVIHKNLHLLTLVGLQQQPVVFPEYRFNEGSEAFRLIEKWALPRRHWVLVNVGGGWPTKVLSVERWVEVIQAFPKIPIALLWGTEEERMSAHRIHDRTGVLLLPRTTFPDLLAIIGQAGVLVSSDTLALHLADVCGTPSVGLFGPTSPKRNGSLNPRSISLEIDRSCRHCHLRRCDRGPCLEEIPVAAIAGAVERLLEEGT